jgi:hypothetical protein
MFQLLDMVRIESKQKEEMKLLHKLIRVQHRRKTFDLGQL